MKIKDIVGINTKCDCGCDIPYFKIVFFHKIGICYFKECTGDWWLRFMWRGKKFKGWRQYSTVSGWRNYNMSYGYEEYFF